MFQWTFNSQLSSHPLHASTVPSNSIQYLGRGVGWDAGPRATQTPTKRLKIDGSFLNLIVFINTITFEVCGVAQNGFLNIVDNPHTSNLKFREIYDYIYYKTRVFVKIRAWCFFCHFNSHVCGQENWFQNRSTEYFSVNNHCTPTLSINQNILHEVRNILF